MKLTQVLTKVATPLKAVSVCAIVLTPLVAHAADPVFNLGITTGLCGLIGYISNTVAVVVITLAVGFAAILHSVNEAREGIVSSVLRVGIGGAVAVSAATIVGLILSKSNVCGGSSTSTTTKLSEALQVLTTWVV